MKNNEKIFTNIFKNKLWGNGESVSGTGSNLSNTINLRKELIYLINKLNIRSILDVPCGDMNWISKIDLTNIKYYGIDIVEDLILQNRQKFKNQKNYIFEKKDAISDSLPKVDLIICRDLIIHFPINAIWSLLENFLQSGSNYLLITEMSVDKDGNKEKNDFDKDGISRNLRKKPFNFMNPLYSILDKDYDRICNPYKGSAKMVLYKIKNLRCYIRNQKKESIIR